ncbi:MAG: acyltransferase [Magnetococcales bacterium]|nr:acyltransferase [Magnetococcales bacterium]
MLYHLFVDDSPVSEASRSLLKHLFLFNGSLAVMLFFVVSGFSLSIGFFSTANDEVLKRLIAGRYLRLAIPVILTLFVHQLFVHYQIIPAAPDWPISLQSTQLFKDAQQSLGFVELLRYGCYDVLIDYTNRPPMIGPLWTIEYELKGSILLLLSLFLYKKFNNSECLLIAVTLFLVLKGKYYYLAFFIGMWMALLFSRRAISSSFSLLALLVGLILSVQTKPNQATLLTCSSLLFYHILASDRSKAFFQNRLSRFLGRISFSLYLIHATVMSSVGIHLSTFDPLDRLQINGIVLVASIVAAMAFQPIDRFSIDLARRFSWKMQELSMGRSDRSQQSDRGKSQPG